jgi:hypothetical protein
VATSLRIFLSYVFNEHSKNAADAFQEVASNLGCTVVTGTPPAADPPHDVVRSRIFSCDCFAALMMPRGPNQDTSAWISNEIGMAYAIDMPLLICKENAVVETGMAALATSYLSFDKNDLDTFKTSLKTLLSQVRHDPRIRRNESLSGITTTFIKRAIEGHKTAGRTPVAVLDELSKTIEAVSTRIPAKNNWLRVRSNNEIVREVFARLNSFEALESKLTIATDKKSTMAQAFVELHGDDLGKFDEVFFESGSTIAELARQLAPKLPKADSTRSTPRVKTNNAFAYLYLWLCENVMCEPVPDGPPDNKYGGMYGALTNRKRAPDYKSPLSDYDKVGLELVRATSAKIFSSPKRARTLVLGAASGLQLSDKITAIYPREVLNGIEQPARPYTNQEILRQLQKNCRGFHVGGYENHLFKRALTMTGAPTIVFIHDTKIDCPIEVGRCHFVSDADLKWASFSRDYPLSVWIACENRTYKHVQSQLASNLRTGGWVSYVYNESSNTPVVIAHNQAYRTACEAAKVRPFSRL